MTIVNQDICGCLPVVFNAIRNALVAFIVVLVVGCAYLGSWDEVMGTWVGQHISDIEKLWGQPDKVISRSDGQHKGISKNSLIWQNSLIQRKPF